MSYLNWHVGMKVVCVDAKWMSGLLRERSVYTVLAVTVEDGSITVKGQHVCLLLQEVRNQHHDSGAFAAYRFRPVHTRDTDISVFTSMLTGTKSKVPA